ECIDTAYVLEDELGVALAPVVVNAVAEPVRGLVSALRNTKLPAPSREAVERRIERTRVQTAQLTRLAEGLPLPQIHLPDLLTARLSLDHITRLAACYEVNNG
ncbi:MAG: hypothetical protein HKN24_10115, partial [Acidimicrobiales bacterium]|nr:hypothetical protein [Acidimicrobiales bacterium]